MAFTAAKLYHGDDRVLLEYNELCFSSVSQFESRVNATFSEELRQRHEPTVWIHGTRYRTTMNTGNAKEENNDPHNTIQNQLGAEEK